MDTTQKLEVLPRETAQELVLATRLTAMPTEAILANYEFGGIERVRQIVRKRMDAADLARDDKLLTADELDLKYNPNGGGEHPKYQRKDWRWAVANEDTLLGYWYWVERKPEDEDC